MGLQSTAPHHEWLKAACLLATRSLPQDVPVGALILDEQGQVVGEGWNQREVDFDPSGHAEIMALREAGKKRRNWRLNDCTLYVTLEPCPMCLSAILQARISMLVFGATDPIQGACGSALNLASQSPIKIVGGIEEEACKTQLQNFFQTMGNRK